MEAFEGVNTYAGNYRYFRVMRDTQHFVFTVSALSYFSPMVMVT